MNNLWVKGISKLYYPQINQVYLSQGEKPKNVWSVVFLLLSIYFDLNFSKTLCCKMVRSFLAIFIVVVLNVVVIVIAAGAAAAAVVLK